MIGNACKTLQRLALLATLACLAVPAAAAPPPNDDFDNAIVVGSLPFSDTQEGSEATVAADDPGSTCAAYLPYTVWYTFTPATDLLVDASPGYAGAVHVYTGTRGNLGQVACGGYQSTVRFPVAAGTTYYILITVSATPPLPAHMTFTLTEAQPPPPPPVNDEIAYATAVPSLPFSESTNMTSATVSPGDASCYYYSTASIWYSFTPSQDVRVEVNATSPGASPILSVSTGSPGQLVTLSCEAYSIPFGARIRFDAAAGVTYWVMIGTTFSPFGNGPVLVSFAEAPPPFSLGVTADRGSVVMSTGEATVSGTVTCSEPAFLTVSGSLRQERAGKAIEGWFWANVSCEGAGRAAWSATPYYGLGLFRGRSAFLFTGGRAEARVRAYGNGTTTGDYDEESIVSPLHLGGAH